MRLRNAAAWMTAEKTPMSVAEAPFPECGEDELVIRNHAVAINPVDWKIQSSGGFGMKYPAILGEDVAGEILEVGSKLKDKFRVGQRVISHVLGIDLGPSYGGFQLYPLLKGLTTSLIPDNMPFTDASVLPLSISTAAAGLFVKVNLGLRYPNTKRMDNEPCSFDTTENSSTLLLWGGSSSVGSSVIQLASASGYDVITTASPSNYEYCKALGATAVLDYHDPQIVSILIDLMKGRDVVGAYDAIGAESTVSQCAAVLHALGGGKVVSDGSAPKDLFEDVEAKRFVSEDIVTQEPEVAEKIWGDYVPSALESGKLAARPKPFIIGNGLEEVQEGLDRQKQGVSARKVIVML